MVVIEKMHEFLAALDRKHFYRYLSVLLIGLTVLTAAGFYLFYTSISTLQSDLESLNETRQRDVKSILSRIEHVKKQRAEVNAILAQDEAFKIGGYFNDILGLLNIAGTKKEETTSQIVLDEDYRESVLSTKLTGLSMKQLTELLNIIEQNSRIYTKGLEIQKSTAGRSIDVSLTIATLQPRTAATE